MRIDLTHVSEAANLCTLPGRATFLTPPVLRKRRRSGTDEKTILKRAVKMLLVSGLARYPVLFLISLYMIRKGKPNIISADDAAAPEDVNCIVVLGYSIRPDGTPSGILRDRLDKGIELYEGGVLGHLFMSGDHGRANYDEANRMKQYVTDTGTPSRGIFMDHAGFSTYESMYRIRGIFQVKKIIIIIQRYHMYWALYVTRAMGMEVYGVESGPRQYGDQEMRDLRELLARPKDSIYVIVMSKPTYLGDAAPVNGDDNVTSDKEENRDRNKFVQK